MTAVLLIDIDSKIPNLALMKVASFYRSQGIECGFNVSEPTHAYISCVFKKNASVARSACDLLRLQYPDIQIDLGGGGVDLHKTLPTEIEMMRPDYTLYPTIDYALGFTTRGCIRHCPFCIVPTKEGQLHRVSTIEDIYDPRFKAIKLLDNNVLADYDNFRHICEFVREHDLRIDFSQGLDARRLSRKTAELLASVKPMKTFCFAFDSLSYRSAVERSIGYLRDAGINLRGEVQFYVYCDQGNGAYRIESAIQRCNLLKSWGTNPYVMLNIDSPPTKKMRHLKRWANRKHIFWSCEFEDYLRTMRCEE